PGSPRPRQPTTGACATQGGKWLALGHALAGLFFVGAARVHEAGGARAGRRAAAGRCRLPGPADGQVCRGGWHRGRCARGKCVGVCATAGWGRDGRDL
ncbi:hypothetical protein TSOC_008447, partial [Tetrabaena socialis]